MMGDVHCESVSVQEFEVGAIYSVVVREVRDYGLIVELAPGVDALLHKSQLSHKYVSHSFTPLPLWKTHYHLV